MPWKGNDIRNTAALRKLRRELLVEHPVCMICGQAMAREIDHLKPVSEGGTNERLNLITVCSPCNREKGRGEKLRGIYRGVGRRNNLTGFCIHGIPHEDDYIQPCKECAA